jgi:membrane-bound lytic murein transglycosylase B
VVSARLPSRLVVALACLVVVPCSASAATFECRIGHTDQWRTVAQDLAARFPAAVGECRILDRPVATPSRDPDDDSRPGRRTAPLTSPDAIVRVVTSRWTPVASAAWQPPPHWWDVVASTAERHGVDARLIQAVIQVESGYASNARSPKGAIGLMQLMPATAARYGATSADSLFDPRVNVEVGVRYLRDLLDQFGRTDLALAAYNAGEGAVVRHGYQVPPYRETQDYVRKVHRLYKGTE